MFLRYIRLQLLCSYKL